MRPKFNLPKRQYWNENDKKMVSLRMSETLWVEVDRVAKEYGWTTTDVAVTALDQFCVWAEDQRKKMKK